MKVLIVCSGNSGYISPFVREQVNAIAGLGIETEIYPIVGKGVSGYLRNTSKIKKKIDKFSPDLIHAHYGLSGLASCLQGIVPVVITFHGSDAHIFYVKILSQIAARLSDFNIFVEQKVKIKIKGHKKNAIVPCGIDLDKFYPIDKKSVREELNFDQSKKYISFSSRFDNVVKNYMLAKESIIKANLEAEFIELKNKTRDQVNLLLNACDMLLLTSKSEGSPQIIKEAMACNCPIVATDVGDIKEIISNTEGCFITSFDPDDVADKIKKAIKFGRRTNGRKKIARFDNKIISNQVYDIYNKVLNENV